MAFPGDPILFVESRFGLELHKVSREEWAGPCIFCGGKDRGRYFLSGRYWCRPGAGHCGKSGWLDELDGADKPTREQMLEWRVAALERQVQEHAQRLTVLEKMHRCADHLAYHRNLSGQNDGLGYWLGEGMTWDTIEKYQLGWCPSCPTYPLSASYTIPVVAGGKLFNIRHRLASTDSGSKYRPHMAGLPSMIFNADDLHRHAERAILVLEGEKKSLMISQETHRPNIAIMGCASFSPAWVSKFDKWRTVLVCLDPDAGEKAAQVAALFGERGRVVSLPAKADDFFARLGGTVDDFAAYLKTAKPVRI